MKLEFEKTHDFIKKRWKDGVKENHEGEYAIPYPFVPPCIDGLFLCLFYWDTYYTNKGLILDGYVDLAKSNTSNLLYLCNKYGHVPNSNSYPGVKHNSQPPYLHLMVKDIFAETKDLEWLRSAYFTLKVEYSFWMRERITPCGLNRYHHHDKTDQECIDFYDYVATRLEIDPNASPKMKMHDGSAYNACAESGLDFSPRYGTDGNEICPIDLNCLLFAMEGNMADWAVLFEPEMEKEYRLARQKRKKLIEELLYCKEEGVYFDYNFKKNTFERTDLYFTGQFFPYIVGISNDRKGCSKVLSKVEYAYGIASTSPYGDKISYQAAYPFSWPYDNGICFWGLSALGMKENAMRVGTKYLELCSKSYMKAGHLWETYNAVVDEVASKKEYPNKEMMGWTAGIYEWIFDYISKNS
ncbi:MAG: alpha,alpha-trehalase [Bacilli bacterium]|nr:alpha,alpha-trehalase [Bacilli bacterium]